MADNTAARLAALARPIVEGMGLRIWDTEFVKEGADYYLRLFIDKDGSISTEDCEAVSQALNEPLDKADLVSHSYIFEVCSPGLERRLRREEQYRACLGQKANLRLFTPVEGKKEWIGILSDCSDSEVTLQTEAGAVSVAIKNISRAHTVFDF